MYTKIMVAVDGSVIAKAALNEAVQLAKDVRAELLSIYVVEYPHIYISDLGYDPAPIAEALLNEGARVLEGAESVTKSQNIRSRSLLVNDRDTVKSVAEVLHQSADDYEAGVVVLGTHGRGGFKRFLLGSVAEEFVRMSTRPILLVPGKARKTM